MRKTKKISAKSVLAGRKKKGSSLRDQKTGEKGAALPPRTPYVKDEKMF